MLDQPASDDPGIQLKLISRKMVHSLNNMLFIMSSYAQFIKETHSDQETLENIQRIETAADECQRITTAWRKEADKLIPDPPET